MRKKNNRRNAARLQASDFLPKDNVPGRFICARAGSRRALTRVEVVMVLAGLTLLIAVALPVIANHRPRFDQVMCVGNLRQIGQASQIWAGDHVDRLPWFTPTNEGGTYFTSSPFRDQAWFQLSWLSNELANPRILVDPADQPRMVATSWGADPVGGFISANFRSNSVSYFAGMHTHYSLPTAILSGDHNLRGDQLGQSCSTGVNAAGISRSPGSGAWTNAVHGQTGNLSFVDGRVEETSTATLRQALDAERHTGTAHLIMP